MVKEKRYRAWHFVGADRHLRFDASDLTVEPECIYSIEPHRVPKLCDYGMHGSIRAIDALGYAHSGVVTLVDIWGNVRIGDDKLVGRHREVLAMCDATKVLHRFACWCVRETPLPDGRKVWDLLTDERSRRAVEVKEAWIDGLATDAELAAAWFAARAATLDAAWFAALDAARAARDAALDAQSAAWDAALDAARAARVAARNAALDAARAAWDAALDAARYARVAARNAALDAARAARDAALDAARAARDAQNTQLEKMLLAEMGR